MRKIYFLLFIVLWAASSNAQLTGTKNIPGDYGSLDAAITDLNTQGVGAGGVVLNLVAGNPQTAPAGGYSITTTGTAANPITLQGNGNTITASAALVAGNLNDAILKLIGSDYVTITGFIMQENAANTTIAAATNNMTEWGVALLHASVTDGCQNNTIQGNTISLNRTYTNSFGIYSNNRHSATNVTTAEDVTNNTTAPNSGNKIYSNIISNVNFGITMIGSTNAANMDVNNDVGGAGVGTGNTITNWGGAVAATTFVSNIATSYCVYMEREVSVNVSFNTLTSAAVNFSGTFLGIYVEYTTTAPTGTFTNNVNSNTVTMTNGFAGAASQIHVIRHSSAGGANVNATANINNNSVLNCAITGASSAITLFGVLNTAPFGTVNLNSNIVKGITSTATTGGIVGVTSQGAVITTLNLNNNQCGNASGNFITFSAATSGAVNAITTSAVISANVSISNNDVRGIIFNNAASTSSPLLISNTYAGSGTANVNNNTFTNLSLNTTGSVAFIQHAGNMTATGVENCNNNSIVTGFNKPVAGGTVTFFTSNASSVNGSAMINTGNNFSNVTVTGATTIAGWSNTEGASTSSAPTKTITGNTFTNITGGSNAITVIQTNFGNATTCTGNTISNVTGTGAITGISHGSNNGQGTHSYSSNSISGLISSGTGGAVTGITGGSTSVPTVNINNNGINNLSSTGASSTVAGIAITAGAIVNAGSNTISSLTGSGATSPLVRGLSVSSGTTVNISKNKIYDLSETGAISTTAGAVNGLLFSGGTTVNAFNNLLGDMRTPAASLTDAIRGINITSTSGTTTFNISYNTININASSSGVNFGTTGLFHTFSTTATSATLNLRNNIIVNNSNPAGTGLTVAFRRSAATNLNNYGATSNNNLFFAGGPCTNRLIFNDGTNSDQTLAAFKTRVSTRDAASVTEDPSFVSTTGSSASFLHINPAIATQIEGGAATIATVTDDYDGDVRGGTPDIGADEFAGIAATVCSGAPVAGTISPVTPTICNGQSTTICLSGQTAASGISIQWQSSTTPGGPYTNVSCAGANCLNTGALTTGTYYYVAVVTCATSGLSATSNEVAITVLSNPAITVNPPTPSICTGGSGVPLTASGAVTYTWSPATGLSATTGATVTANPTVTTTYTVTGTNAAGCSSSTTVTVTVGTSPAITSIASSSPTVCPTGTVDLTSSATTGLVSNLTEGFEGGVLPAGWVSINSGTGNLWTIVTPSSGSPRTGTKAAEYSFNSSQAANAYLITSGLYLTAGSTYTVSSWYRSSGTTFPEKLKVTVGTAQTVAAQTTIIQDVGTVSSTTYAQQSATFTPAVTGMYYFAWNCYSLADEFYLDVDDIAITGGAAPPAPTYAWTSSPAGFTSSLQNPTGVAPTGETTVYTLTATNPLNGCPSSANVTVTIDPKLFTVTGGGSYCNGGTGVAVGLSGSQSGVNYQLQLNGSDVGALTPGNGSAINFGLQTAGGSYTVIATNPATTCTRPMTGSVSVGINPLPTISGTLTQPTTCVSADGAINLTISGTSGPYTFSWSTVGGSGLVAGQQDQSGLTIGQYVVIVTATTTGCQETATFNLSGPGGCAICPTIPSVTTTPLGGACEGSPVTLTASGLTSMGNTYGVTFKYSTSALADPYTSGTVIATVPNGSLTVGGTTASTTTTLPASGNYFIYAILSPVPIDPSCRPSAQSTFIVGITPTVNSVSNQGLCNNSNTAAVNFSGTPAGATFNWTNNTTSIGLAASGSGNIPSFVATNAGTAPVVATVTVTPSLITPLSITQTFNYTGSMQTWTVPPGVTSITIDAYGAGGGTGAAGNSNAGQTLGGPGGKGTKATGTLAVTPGQVLNIFVGGAGAIPTGGFNGGGTGGNANSGGGGGASDIRYPGTTTSDRIIVAGGGGGGGRGGCESANNINGGAGGDGDANGANGTDAPTSGGFAGAGGGGILSTGGVAGVGCGGFLGQPGASASGAIGGNGGAGQACCCFSFSAVPGGGGGGGGYLGGGGGGGGSAGTTGCSGNDKGAGGGGAGGSSYTGGVIGGGTTLGLQAGDGLVAITYSTTSISCPGTPKTFTITVNPTPTVNAVANQILCNNSSTAAVTFGGAVTGTVYNWTNNTTSIGLAASGTGNIAAFTATNTGTTPVTATITVTPSYTNAGATCTGVPKTFTITVNPTPNAVATPSTQTLCTGVPITTIVLSGNVSGTIFNWTRNNTTNVTGIAASGAGNISGTLTNTTTTQQTVTFTITPTANGCPGTPIVATVIVNPLPTVTCPANITKSNDAGVCGAIVTYPVATATGIPAPTITYSQASGTLFPVGTTTVNVTATNTCGVATCSFTVTVNDTQAPTVSCPASITKPSDPGVCTASIAVPNATTADNCAVTKLTWALTGATIASSPATGINNIGTRTFNFGQTTATYTVSDAAGNTNTCSFTITVTDGQVPVITTQPVNRTVCTGSNATFSVVSTNAVSYQWQTWNGTAWVNVPSGTSASLTLNAVTVAQNTNTYHVIITGICTVVTSNAATLFVNALPTINLVASRIPILLPTETVTLTANTNPGGGSYVWFKNGAVLPGVTGAVLPDLTVDNAGTYRVVYTDPNGCTSTSGDITVSAAPSANFYVYPNPNTGVFHVRFYNTPNSQATLSVYDARGARVYSKAAITTTAYTVIDVDISKQPAGVYLVEVRDSNGKLAGSKRIIVGH